MEDVATTEPLTVIGWGNADPSMMVPVLETVRKKLEVAAVLPQLLVGGPDSWMSNCVYIDLGDGDFIKPNFSKPPTPAMIEEARQWGLAQKRMLALMKAEGICLRCEGKGTFRGRDLDSPTFKITDRPCTDCNGTGKRGTDAD